MGFFERPFIGGKPNIRARRGRMQVALRRLLVGLAPLVLMVTGSPAARAQETCPDLHLTRHSFAPHVTDLAAAIRAEAGPDARPAEWSEVKACYAQFGLGYFHRLGVVKTDPRNQANPPRSQGLVVVNGNRYFQPPSRAYFAAFHEGTLPRDWLAHDQVGGNKIALGSWSYLLPAFYVLDRSAPPPPTTKAALEPVVPARTPEFRRRVALVIGNADYRAAGKLANPANDAADMAVALRKLDFSVVEGRNLDRRGMDDVVRQFARELDGADLALLFYAGHALQVGGKNYLVPVDAVLERPGDLALDTIELGVILAQLEAEKRVSLIFLDACRDNPLARSLARSMATRSMPIGHGLASIQSALGTMIAYATQPDNVALDGAGRNSPFTAALLRHIHTPGLDIAALMRRVRADVVAETRDKQVPWDHSSLIGEVVLAR